MRDKVVSKEPFMLKYFPDKYKNQEMCDEAVDFYLITLNLFLISLLQIKCYKNLTILYFLMVKYFFMMQILTLSHFLLVIEL